MPPSTIGEEIALSQSLLSYVAQHLFIRLAPVGKAHTRSAVAEGHLIWIVADAFQHILRLHLSVWEVPGKASAFHPARLDLAVVEMCLATCIDR